MGSGVRGVILQLFSLLHLQFVTHLNQGVLQGGSDLALILYQSTANDKPEEILFLHTKFALITWCTVQVVLPDDATHGSFVLCVILDQYRNLQVGADCILVPDDT